MEKYKGQIQITIVVLLFLNLLVTCNGNSKVKSLSKRVIGLDSVVVRIESRPTPLTDGQIRDAVRDEIMESMYQYLIYETDLDKGKTSLSQIKSDVQRIKTK